VSENLNGDCLTHTVLMIWCRYRAVDLWRGRRG